VVDEPGGVAEPTTIVPAAVPLLVYVKVRVYVSTVLSLAACEGVVKLYIASFPVVLCEARASVDTWRPAVTVSMSSLLATLAGQYIVTPVGNPLITKWTWLLAFPPADNGGTLLPSVGAIAAPTVVY
jgi:hypothetical protein